MISNLDINGYRGFKRFEISQLSRINLLVGTNNSGKTSVLEALYLLASNSDPQAIWRILVGRGEQRFTDPNLQRQMQMQMQQELELNHLFYGHQIKLDTTIKISASNSERRIINLSIVEAKAEDNPQLFLMTSNDVFDPVGVRLALSVQSGSNRITPIPLTPRGSIRQDAIQHWTNLNAAQPVNIQQANAINAQYVSNASLTGQELSASWNSIALTDDEDRIIQALKFLDPNIERIATTNAPFIFNQNQRGGFLVKMSNITQPIPIGSLGDGVWRMLALAIALIRSRNGILLVDEIDTGLHYSVMSRMWTMIAEASRHFNIQVFASTHSSDCISALASIGENEIGIHRIESDKDHSVLYSAKEIRVAAEQNIEVR